MDEGGVLQSAELGILALLETCNTVGKEYKYLYAQSTW